MKFVAVFTRAPWVAHFEAEYESDGEAWLGFSEACVAGPLDWYPEELYGAFSEGRFVPSSEMFALTFRPRLPMPLFDEHGLPQMAIAATAEEASAALKQAWQTAIDALQDRAVRVAIGHAAFREFLKNNPEPQESP